MYLPTFLLATSLALPAIAFRSVDHRRHTRNHLVARDDSIPVGEWRAPGPGDIRSPCPGLNTLANHGYLPRDGRNVHVTDIVTAMNDYLGVAVSAQGDHLIVSLTHSNLMAE